MIVRLRNNHIKFWVLIALILPVAFIYAALNVPEKGVSDFSRKLVGQLPNIISEIENDDLKVLIRANQNNQFQIEVLVKNPIAVPSGVFHLVKTGESFTDRTTLGNLNSHGLHRFQIQTNPLNSKLLLVDYISKSVVLELQL